ncbi:hypothetical protein IFR05_016210 [Cadophora sp. M221]|nr:hypothetical protein IFR05_016210 [Cadophora sp. M221]
MPNRGGKCSKRGDKRNGRKNRNKSVQTTGNRGKDAGARAQAGGKILFVEDENGDFVFQEHGEAPQATSPPNIPTTSNDRILASTAACGMQDAIDDSHPTRLATTSDRISPSTAAKQSKRHSDRKETHESAMPGAGEDKELEKAGHGSTGYTNTYRAEPRVFGFARQGRDAGMLSSVHRPFSSERFNHHEKMAGENTKKSMAFKDPSSQDVGSTESFDEAADSIQGHLSQARSGRYGYAAKEDGLPRLAPQGRMNKQHGIRSAPPPSWDFDGSIDRAAAMGGWSLKEVDETKAYMKEDLGGKLLSLMDRLLITNEELRNPEPAEETSSRAQRHLRRSGMTELPQNAGALEDVNSSGSDYSPES